MLEECPMFLEIFSLYRATLITVLSLVSSCVLVAEWWSGIAVVGWTGDNMVIEREKSPGPYWFTMTLHTFVGLTLPLAAIFV